jgi:hypothetical protein
MKDCAWMTVNPAVTIEATSCSPCFPSIRTLMFRTLIDFVGQDRTIAHNDSEAFTLEGPAHFAIDQ